MIWVFLLVVLAYLILVAKLALGVSNVLKKSIDLLPTDNANKQSDRVRFSLVIPFRNEMHNLPRLLQCLKDLHYPKNAYEIILVNDLSEDSSVKIIEDFIIQNKAISLVLIENVRKSISPKKDAITTAIAHSNFEWIVTTDADCTFKPNWLSTLSEFILQNKSKMVAGPVRIGNSDQTTFLNAFEQLDFLSLMGATMGGFGIRKPFLCNGANLAYEKKAFTTVSGFAQNDHIASGDDHFLLEKFTVKYPERTHYIASKECIITTIPQEDWSSFFSQRIRWAAKGTGYNYWFSKFVGIMVLLANVAAIALLLYLFLQLSLINSWNFRGYAFAKAILPLLTLLFIGLKFLADYWLISSASQFLDRGKYFRWFLPVALCYPFLSCFIAVKALIGGFAWKGRRYNR